MLRSQEELRRRTREAIKDPILKDILLDLTDSAWQWREGAKTQAPRDRWVTVGGQTVKGTTANEKAPTTEGGQTDGQGQTASATKGEKWDKGDRGPAGPTGPAGALDAAQLAEIQDQLDALDAKPHDSLQGLDAGGYHHLTAAQFAALTGGASTTIHFHSEDRSRSNHTGTQLAVTISDFASAADARIAAQKGVANGIAPLGSDTRIPLSYLPATTIVETSVVASQAAMLALTAQQGDVAVRTDLSKTYILKAEPASTLGNWQELLSPTDAVVSVFGRTGPVTAQSGDYSAFYQPLDADLTAIASLTTQTFGRSLLTAADAAAARTLLGAQAAGSYQAASSVLTSIAAQSSGTGLLKLTAGVASLDSTAYLSTSGQAYDSARLGGVVAASYALASAIPAASSTTPAALGTAAVGTGTTWARADHVHAMPTAAQVGALGATAQAVDSAKLGGQLPAYYALESTIAYIGTGAVDPNTLTHLQSGYTQNTAANRPGNYAFVQTLGRYNGGSMQLASDSYGSDSNSLWWRRKGDNGTWYPWKTIWHTGNLTGTRNEHNHAGSYVDLSTDQTIAGMKTLSYKTIFNNGISVGGTGASFDILDSAGVLGIKGSTYSTILATFNASTLRTNIYRLETGYVCSDLLPLGTSTFSLGDSSTWWNYLYVSNIKSTSIIFSKEKFDVSTTTDGNVTYLTRTSGGVSLETATPVGNYAVAVLITGQISSKWFSFPSPSSAIGRRITVICTSSSYGAYLVSSSGYFRYNDGSLSLYNNTSPPSTPSSTWVSDGIDWHQVG